MPIRYALYENNLTTDPHDYAAVVQISGAADLEAVAQRMIERGSTVTKADTPLAWACWRTRPGPWNPC